MTPMFEVKGIIATHFENKYGENKSGKTMMKSYDEINLVLDLWGFRENIRFSKAALCRCRMKCIL